MRANGENSVFCSLDGLTTREYFAGFALAGMLANSDRTASSAAFEALEYADALIRELKRTEGK